MRWKYVDFERREWFIPETKNRTSQTITLTDEAIVVLKKRQKNAKEKHQEKSAAKIDYVFPGSGRTGHLVEPKKVWCRILDNAGIEDLRLHDLRRTLGSWQARMGAALAIIGNSLNHKSPSATAIYARLDLDPVRDSVEKATQAIFAAGKIKPTEPLTLNLPEEVSS